MSETGWINPGMGPLDCHWQTGRNGDDAQGTPLGRSCSKYHTVPSWAGGPAVVPLDAMLPAAPGGEGKGRGVRPSGVQTNRRLTGFWTGWRSLDIHGFPSEALIASMGTWARSRVGARAQRRGTEGEGRGGEERGGGEQDSKREQAAPRTGADTNGGVPNCSEWAGRGPGGATASVVLGGRRTTMAAGGRRTVEDCEPVDGILSRPASLLAAHGDHASRRKMPSLGSDRLVVGTAGHGQWRGLPGSKNDRGPNFHWPEIRKARAEGEKGKKEKGKGSYHGCSGPPWRPSQLPVRLRYGSGLAAGWIMDISFRGGGERIRISGQDDAKGSGR